MTDNCPARPQIENLKSIKLFFPPPTEHNFSESSKGPGCLHSMKAQYHKNIERKIIQSVKKKKSPDEFLCYL